jgi:hypothetical protein
VSGIADPFNGHIDELRIAHVQRTDGWVEITWNNMSDPGAFAAAVTEEGSGARVLLVSMRTNAPLTYVRIGRCQGRRL